MSFIQELKRRNVFRVGIAYALMGWVLLQGADFALDLIDAPNWVIQALSVVVIIGLPIALFFAWAFELTPEGIKREHEVDRTASIAQKTGRKLDFMIIGVLVLAVGYLLFDKFSGPMTERPGAEEVTQAEPAAEAETGHESVAVLPFVNMSDDQQNEYFSDGLTETLLHMLAQLPDLQVAARTSSFAFKGQNKSVGEIAAVLGVAHILEGSVQKAGERVRVTAQLVRAKDGFHIWSQNYTRPIEDIFAIQDEIAADVANALGASLLGESSTQMVSVDTHNVGAYDSYLKGLEQQAIFSYSSLPEAEIQFQKALVQDPEFTEARLALARNHILKFWTGLTPREETLAETRPLLRQVLDKNPDNLLAQAYEIILDARTSIGTLTQAQIREKAHQLRGLLTHLPTDSLIREVVAQIYHYALHDSDEALALLQAGLILDPLDANLYQVRGNVYRDTGDFDRSESSLLRALELGPDDPNTYSWLGDLELERDNLPAAMEWFRKAIEVDPNDHELAMQLAKVFYDLDLPEEAGPWVNRVNTLVPGSPAARLMAAEKTFAQKQYEETAAITQTLISEQVENRRNSFFDITFLYSVSSIELGRAREAYDFLVSQRPEINQFDQLPEDNQGKAMQQFAVLLMAGFASPGELRSAWLQHATARDAYGFDWREDGDRSRTAYFLMNGELENAVQHELQHRYTKPLAGNLNMHKTRFPDFYRELYDDPRIMAAQGARERDYLQVRETVSQMLQKPEWN